MRRKCWPGLAWACPARSWRGRSFTVRTIDMATRQQRFYPRDYINIDRERFDRWLVSLLPRRWKPAGAPGFATLSGTTRGVVTFTVNGKERRETCRLAVAPTAPALGAPRLAPRRQPQVAWQSRNGLPSPRPIRIIPPVFDPGSHRFLFLDHSQGRPAGGGLGHSAGADVLGRFQLLKDKLAQWGYVLDEPVRRHVLTCSGQLAWGKYAWAAGTSSSSARRQDGSAPAPPKASVMPFAAPWPWPAPWKKGTQGRLPAIAAVAAACLPASWPNWANHRPCIGPGPTNLPWDQDCSVCK